MSSKMPSAMSRTSRVALMAMKASGSKPDLSTFLSFVVLLKVLPDSRRGRAIRTDRANLALATVGISHVDWGVGVVDRKGISSRTAEEHGSVLADIIVLIISGHPAHTQLVVLGVVKLPVVVSPGTWGHLCRLRFLDGCRNQQIKAGLGWGLGLGLGLGFTLTSMAGAP